MTKGLGISGLPNSEPCTGAGGVTGNHSPHFHQVHPVRTHGLSGFLLPFGCKVLESIERKREAEGRGGTAKKKEKDARGESWHIGGGGETGELRGG